MAKRNEPGNEPGNEPDVLRTTTVERKPSIFPQIGPREQLLKDVSASPNPLGTGFNTAIQQPRIQDVEKLMRLAKPVQEMLNHLPDEIEDAIDNGLTTKIADQFRSEPLKNTTARNIRKFVADCDELYKFIKTAQYNDYDRRVADTKDSSGQTINGIKTRLLINISAAAQRANWFLIELEEHEIPNNVYPVLNERYDETGNHNLSDFARGIDRDLSGLRGDLSFLPILEGLLELGKRIIED